MKNRRTVLELIGDRLGSFLRQIFPHYPVYKPAITDKTTFLEKLNETKFH